jgi:shikimate kinase
VAAIYLAGFMGSGKSTVGKLLAKRLGCPFRDLDDIIVATQGRSIASIFESEGEAAFRAIETAALREQIQAAAGENFVLALGGGAFPQAANRRMLAGSETVWLDCPLERVQARAALDPARPLARDPGKFARLYRERRAAYAEARHRVEIVSDDPEDAVRAILAGLGMPGARGNS